MGVLLACEEGLEGEGAVKVGDAQVASFKGKPRAEEGEVRGITPQGAARAVSCFRWVRGSEAGRVRSGECVVHG